MRAINLIHRRRQRAREKARRGPRLVRALATGILLLALALVFALAVALAAGAGAVLAFVRDLPEVSALAAIPARYQPSAATTRLYAWDEPDDAALRRPVLIDEIADPRREGGGWTRLADLPPSVAAATLATADPSFLDRPAPDLAAAVIEWWRTGTVTQPQSPLLRDLIAAHLRGQPAPPDDNRRALQDWFLGWQIEQRFSRAQVLEWTLNTTYYGHLAFGIDAAARVYFDKAATELTPGEAALLAAVGRDPALNPFDEPEAARAGQAAVLDKLARAGHLTAAGVAAIAAEPLTLAAPPGSDSSAPAFSRLARAELEQQLGPAELLRGGWQVETTLDLTRQHAAACIIRAATGQASAGGGPPCPDIDVPPGREPAQALAIVALDPRTGEITALAGDALAARSTGTLVRPFIYLTALSQGYTAASLTLDVPQIYLQDGRPYTPRNSDGQYRGPLRLREALAQGRDAAAVQVLSWVGRERVLNNARALGLSPAGAPVDLTFAADGFVADLLGLGRAFGVVANGGAMAGTAGGRAPATIRRVRNARGEEVYTFAPETREALSPELAWLLTDMLAGEEGVATATGASTAGDAWAIAYSTNDLAGVWASGIASEAATAAARALHAGESAARPGPAGLRALNVCALSGLLPQRGAAACPTVREWFVAGTEPVAVDTMTRESAVNRQTGRLATIFTPPGLIERRVFTVFPPEAARWAAGAGIPTPPIEYDTIRRVPTRSGGAAVSSPEPWSAVSGQWSVVGSAGGPNFAYYRLSVFPGLLPEAVQPLVERGETPVQNGELGVWDTTLFDDGLYTLLLTVVHGDGTFDEVAVPVTVANE